MPEGGAWDETWGRSPEGPAQEDSLSPCDGACAELSAKAPRTSERQKPSRARAVSSSEIVESQTLGGREQLVWVVTDGSRASSLLAISA